LEIGFHLEQRLSSRASLLMRTIFKSLGFADGNQYEVQVPPELQLHYKIHSSHGRIIITLQWQTSNKLLQQFWNQKVAAMLTLERVFLN
jgi:hypothetical protein